MLFDRYRSRRVLLTGHTGFKGAWLAEWLLQLGADVVGYSLLPPTRPALFDQLGLAPRLSLHVLGDVRDLAALKQVVIETKPHFVFHLAAQPLVRHSYQEPVETYATNVLGTVNVLEAIRIAGMPCSVVVATSDKCYENHEQNRPYREDEALGGHDPYSSSKACAELVASAYRRSFFNQAEKGIAVATARAGNVLGGGDWAVDRILPDCIRSLQRGEAIAVRNPTAVRPWQHVLEPLSGYLALGSELAATREGSAKVRETAGAFNFGPDESAHRPVAEVVTSLLGHWPGTWLDASVAGALHEAQRLQLSIEKASELLRWKPVWSFEQAVTATAKWYRAFAYTAEMKTDADEVASFTREQIARYSEDARRAGLAWAGGSVRERVSENHGTVLASEVRTEIQNVARRGSGGTV